MLIKLPAVNEAPSTGAVIATTGAVFTVTVIEAEPKTPPLSVTDAVMVWVPTERVAIEKETPVPIAPSRSEDHDRLAAISPSSVSMALPVNVIKLPAVNEAPSTGAVIATTGAVLTVTVIQEEPKTPPLSVTDAVIVWVPTERVAIEKEPPVPIAPSRSEDHDRLAEISPSSVSMALPVK